MIREIAESWKQLPNQTIKIWSADRKMSAVKEEIFLQYYKEELNKQTTTNNDEDNDEQQLPNVRPES